MKKNGQIKIPQLSLEERDRRWRRIKERMVERGLDCLIIQGDSGKWDSRIANVRYVTGIGGNGEDAIAIFSFQGEPTVFIWSGSGVGWWAKCSTWTQDIRTGAPYWSKAVSKRLKEMGLAKARIGLVGLEGLFDPEGSFSHVTYRKLLEELPEATFENATDIIETLRLIKSPEEISFISKAARIGDLAIDKMKESAKSGIEEFKVYADMVHTMMYHGSEFPMLLWEAGPSPSHAGKFPGHRKLRKGDIIVNEISPRYGGYFAHPHQPLAIGKPDPKYVEMFKIVIESFHEGMAKIKPGASLGEVDRAFTEPILKAGYTSNHPSFHGMGLAMPEFPHARILLKPDFNPDEGLILRENMVLAVEPIVCTLDRRKGIPIGDTVVVTEKGPKRLSRRPLELIMV